MEKQVEQLKKELTMLKDDRTVRTKEASEMLAKFVLENQGADPLVTRQPDNPYLGSPIGSAPGCCIVS